MSPFKCLIFLCGVIVVAEAASLRTFHGRADVTKKHAGGNKQKIGNKNHSSGVGAKSAYNLKSKITEAQILIHNGIRSIKDNLDEYTKNNNLPKVNETNWSNLNATMEKKISKLKDRISARNSPSQQEAIWETFVKDFESVSGSFVHNVSKQQEQQGNKNDKQQTIIVIVLEKGFGGIVKELKDLPSENTPGYNYAERSNQIPKTIFALLSVFTHSTEASIQHDPNPTQRPLQVLAGQIGQAISNLGSFRPPVPANETSNVQQSAGSPPSDAQNEGVASSSQRPLQALAGQISQAINSLVTPRPQQQDEGSSTQVGGQAPSSPRPFQVLAGQISQAIQNINNLAFRPQQNQNVTSQRPQLQDQQRPPQQEQKPLQEQQAPQQPLVQAPIKPILPQQPEAQHVLVGQPLSQQPQVEQSSQPQSEQGSEPQKPQEQQPSEASDSSQKPSSENKVDESTSPPRIIEQPATPSEEQSEAASSEAPPKSEDNAEGSPSEAPLPETSSFELSSEKMNDEVQTTTEYTTLNPLTETAIPEIQFSDSPSSESPSSESIAKSESTEAVPVLNVETTENQPQSTEIPVPENPPAVAQSDAPSEVLPEKPLEIPPRIAEVAPAQTQPVQENIGKIQSTESYIPESEKRPISNQVLNIITDKLPSQAISNTNEIAHSESSESVPVANQALNVIINIIYDKAVTQTSSFQGGQSLNYQIPQRPLNNNKDEVVQEQEPKPQAIQIMVTDANEQTVSNQVIQSEQLQSFEKQNDQKEPVNVIINLSPGAQPDEIQVSSGNQENAPQAPPAAVESSSESLPVKESEQVPLKQEVNSEIIKSSDKNEQQKGPQPAQQQPQQEQPQQIKSQQEQSQQQKPQQEQLQQQKPQQEQLQQQKLQQEQLQQQKLQQEQLQQQKPQQEQLQQQRPQADQPQQLQKQPLQQQQLQPQQEQQPPVEISTQAQNLVSSEAPSSADAPQQDNLPQSDESNLEQSSEKPSLNKDAIVSPNANDQAQVAEHQQQQQQQPQQQPQEDKIPEANPEPEKAPSQQQDDKQEQQVVQAANFTVLTQQDNNNSDYDNKNSIHVLIISSPKAAKH